MRLLPKFLILFLIILTEKQLLNVSATNITTSENIDSACNCSCSSRDERGLTVGGGLGWAAGTAILIFAFSNTVIVAATLVVTYILYHILITAVGILAPGMAVAMAKFLGFFSLL